MILKNGKRIDGCSDTVPIGSLNPFIGTTAPFGYLICQGQLVSKTTYPELYAICGNTFGTATQDEFYLPDLRGQTIAGYKEGDSTFGTLGGLIGEKTHTLTTNEIPSHTHTSNAFTTAPGSPGYLPQIDTSIGWGPSVFETNSTGGGQAHNNIQPTMCLNWMVKAIMLIPNQSTVVNVQSNSPTNVYSCAYINNLNPGGSSNALYVDETLWYTIMYNAPWDTSTTVTDNAIKANLVDVMSDMTIDSTVIYGNKSSTHNYINGAIYTSISTDSTTKTLNISIILSEGIGSIYAVYDIANEVMTTVELSKYKIFTTDPRSTTMLNLQTKLLPGTSYVTNDDKTTIESLSNTLASDPVDIIYIKDGLNNIYEAHYKLTQSAIEKYFTLTFTTNYGECRIQYRDYGYNEDCYVYFNDSNIENYLRYIERDMLHQLVIDPYERTWGNSTYWGGTTQSDSIYNPQQHDVNDGFQWNSTNKRFETKALSSSDTQVESVLEVYNPQWNYNDNLTIEVNVTGSMQIPAMILELYINGDLVGYREAQPNDSQGITLSNYSLQNNDLIKVVAKPVTGTPSNIKAYIDFYTYPNEQTVSATGTQAGFEDNLKNWASSIISEYFDKDKFVTLVKVPDLLSNPDNYNSIIGTTYLVDYNYTTTTGSYGTKYLFNIKTLPFEYNYSPNVLCLEFSYEPDNYNDPLDITSSYVSLLGINPDYLYSKIAAIDTTVNRIFGNTFSWSQINNYLLMDSPFTSLKITNVSAWYPIKLTIESSDLAQPVVTTLSLGQDLTLDDVGITYDSIKAEWSDSTVTEDVWNISEALHGTLNSTSIAIPGNVDITGNLNITGSYQINNDPVIWDDGV